MGKWENSNKAVIESIFIPPFDNCTTIMEDVNTRAHLYGKGMCKLPVLFLQFSSKSESSSNKKSLKKSIKNVMFNLAFPNLP